MMLFITTFLEQAIEPLRDLPEDEQDAAAGLSQPQARLSWRVAGFDAAVKDWLHERFTLRQGIMTIREYPERSRGQ
jgi:hypothetical protein